MLYLNSRERITSKGFVNKFRHPLIKKLSPFHPSSCHTSSPCYQVIMGILPLFNLNPHPFLPTSHLPSHLSLPLSFSFLPFLPFPSYLLPHPSGPYTSPLGSTLPLWVLPFLFSLYSYWMSPRPPQLFTSHPSPSSPTLPDDDVIHKRFLRPLLINLLLLQINLN